MPMENFIKFAFISLFAWTFIKGGFELFRMPDMYGRNDKPKKVEVWFFKLLGGAVMASGIFVAMLMLFDF